MSLTRFEGNCPRNVSKDAKYSVRRGSAGAGDGGLVVALVYEAEDDERWHPSTDAHPELVKMVNAVKTSAGQPPNGAFYINEYRQVIVPVAGTSDYYLAGTYGRPLEFEFEGKHLGGDARDLDGNPIAPGDTWAGPRPGIPYKLRAGGNDIAYTTSPRPNVTREIRLSKEIGPDRAREAASVVSRVKGHAGGRFYVNEHLNAFSPLSDGRDVRYVYCGKIDLDMWFPKPHADHPDRRGGAGGDPRDDSDGGDAGGAAS